jgi:hypothetical protein
MDDALLNFDALRQAIALQKLPAFRIIVEDVQRALFAGNFQAATEAATEAASLSASSSSSAGAAIPAYSYSTFFAASDKPPTVGLAWRQYLRERVGLFCSDDTLLR